MKKTLFTIAAGLALTACGSGSYDADGCIYTCSEFSVYTDSVVQGEYVAKALSPTEIVTNYRSSETSGASPVVRFRFSFNSRDNEMGGGKSHIADVRTTGDHVYTIGSTEGEAAPPASAEADTLAPETPWTVRLDMRPVLRSFRAKGYYATPTGDTIYADDFKGVWIAGSAEPMTWDFENLYGRDGQRLTDRGDSIYEVTLKLNPPRKLQPDPTGWKIASVNKNYPRYTSGQILVDALYNMAVDNIVSDIRPDDTFRAGKEWDGVWTRDVSYSIYLSLAMLDPGRSMNSLRAKVDNGRIIQDTGTGGAWPVSSDRVVWGIAAWEIYLVTGDRAWLEEAHNVLATTLNTDLEVVWDQDYSLMHGEQSYLDWRSQTYPAWMQPADIFGSMCLGTNVVFARSFEILSLMERELGIKGESQGAAMHDRLVTAINDRLWIPNRGYYSEYLYGQPYPIVSQATDNLGQSLAVIFDVASPEMAQSVISKTPVQPYGTSSVFPQMADVKPYHNDAVWPFVQAFWNIAAARTSNMEALSAGLGAIYRAAAMFGTNKELFVSHNGDYRGTAVNSDAQLWSAAGSAAMVFRVYAGMQFGPDGITFEPMVPPALTGVKKITGFKYRGSDIDIIIDGTGNDIAMFKIDGKPVTEQRLPADIAKGKHTVEITMANNRVKSQTVNITPQQWMPATPDVQWTTGHRAEVLNRPDDVDYCLFLNGVLEQEMTGATIDIVGSRQFTAVAIAPVLDQSVWGFSPRPHYLFPAGSVVQVNFADFAKAGTGYIADKQKASQFVELTTTRNTRVALDVNVARAGDYFIDVLYANGSGPINTENKCALRTLSVNSERVGVIVMPQRGTGEWLSTGYSNMLRANLAAGHNTITLEYLEPANVNMNREVNTALVRYMRLIRR